MRRTDKAYPENASRYGPGVHPDCGDGHHAEDMGEFCGARIGIPPKFAAELGQIRDVLRPREGEGKRPEAEDDGRGGEGEDYEHEQQRGVNL